MRNIRQLHCCFILALIVVVSTPAHAAVYYCNPASGNTQSGNGSQTSPWGSFQSILEAGKLNGIVKAGDTVVCLSGYHGQWEFSKCVRAGYLAPAEPITIQGNGDARVGRMVIKSMSNWRFVGLSISPEYGGFVQDTTISPRIIIYGYNNHHLLFEDCTIRTVADRTGWGVNEWTDNVWGGIDIRAADTIYRNLRISSTHYGIKGLSNNCLVEGCRIDGFTDGMTVGGTNVVIQDNTLINVYADRNGTHEDAIQGWGADGSGLTIRRNYICARTDPARPIDGLQGIFLEFDVARGVRIENNVVVCESNHGIKVGEGSNDVLEDLVIVNNTVVKGYATLSGTPDIGFQKTVPTNVVIRNNIAHGFPPANAANQIVVDFNFDVDNCDPLKEFVDYAHGDVRLAKGSRLIDAGSSSGVPSEDLARNARTIGSSTDVGAYEYGSAAGGNRPPTIDAIANRWVQPGQRLDITVNARDPDGDPIEYSATGLPTGATFSGQTFSWTPTTDQLGTYRVTFTASDGQAQASDVVKIVVDVPNTPPVLAAIGGQSVRENETLSFSIGATDADGDAVTYRADRLPSGATFTGQRFAWTPGYNQAGTYNVTFIASDGRGEDSEAVAISVVNVNRPPALGSLGDRSIDENETLAFAISASDPDGDGLTYSARSLPAGAKLAGQKFTWTPTSDQVGSHDITFVASDGELDDSRTVTIVVVSTSVDTTPPVVARSSPAPDAIQVPLNNLVTLHVTDAGRGVDGSTVVIHVNDQVVYEGDSDVYTSPHGRCSRSGTPTDYRFIYQPDATFDFDETVVVQVNATDLPGNTMSEYSYSFVTEMRAFGVNKQVGGTIAVSGEGGPATVRDDAGNIWAVWHDGPAGRRDVQAAKLAPGKDVFETPIRLTRAPGDQCNPDCAVAPDGRLYVVWQSNQRGNWDLMMVVCSDGQTFSAERPITSFDDNETNAAIIIDRQSPARVYVAWQDDRNDNQDVYVASSTDGFATQTVSRVTSDPRDQTEPDLAVDMHNTVYVLWTDMRNGQADLYGAASNAGPWANVPVVVAASAQTSPAVVVAPDDTMLHAVWVDDAPRNLDIYYAAMDGLPGSPLSGSTVVDDTAGADQRSPTLAAAPGSKVFVCWQDTRHVGTYGTDTDLYCAEVTCGRAGTNVLISDGGTRANQSEPAMGINAYGQPYVVWTDDRARRNQIFYSATTLLDPVPLDSKLVVASVGATIGTEPAAIDEPQDVSIVVPAGACQADMRMTISRIINPQVTAVECLGGYDFGPSGIDFDQPVTVTIPYVFSSYGRRARPYWYDSLTGALSQQGITDIENIVLGGGLNALQFKTTHFTPFYLVAGDDSSSTDAASGGGCSISAAGGGAPKDLLLPYGVIALVMIVLRRRDRRRRELLNRSEG